MLLLAIDAATRFTGVALIDGETVLGEYLIQSTLTHSQRLLPVIDLILQDGGKELQLLQGVVVSQGPGSFTGLRIAMGLAKGLAYALELPLVGVCSLEHWALSLALTLPPEARILPLLDAGRGEFYSSLYCWDGERCLEEVAAGARSLPQLQELVLLAPRGLYLTGDVLPRRRQELQEGLGERVVLPMEQLTLPRPVALALLGMAKLAAGYSEELHTLAPRYLRVSEAERLRKAKAVLP